MKTTKARPKRDPRPEPGSITDAQVRKAVEDTSLGELLHTAWRKGVENDRGIWRLIADMPPKDWGAYVDTVGYYLLAHGWRAPR